MSNEGRHEHAFDLGNGRSVTVIVRWYLSGNVPVLGPPKPKGIYFNGGVDDDVRCEVDVQLSERSSTSTRAGEQAAGGSARSVEPGPRE